MIIGGSSARVPTVSRRSALSGSTLAPIALIDGAALTTPRTATSAAVIAAEVHRAGEASRPPTWQYPGLGQGPALVALSLRLWSRLAVVVMARMVTMTASD